MLIEKGMYKRGKLWVMCEQVLFYKAFFCCGYFYAFFLMISRMVSILLLPNIASLDVNINI